MNKTIIIRQRNQYSRTFIGIVLGSPVRKELVSLSTAGHETITYSYDRAVCCGENGHRHEAIEMACDYAIPESIHT